MIFSKQRKRINFLKAYTITYETRINQSNVKSADLIFENKLSSKKCDTLELDFLNELFVEQLHFSKNLIDELGKKFKVYIISDKIVISLDEEKTKNFITYINHLINKEIENIEKETTFHNFLVKPFKEKGEK